jgi:dihydrofolate reductase
MLIVQEFVTVDGFAADADGAFEFGGVISDWSSIANAQLDLVEHAGIIVLGRKTYELFVAHWPTADHPMAQPINTTPKVVVSRSMTAATWGDWPAPTVHRGPLPDVIDRLTVAAAPRDILVWGSLALTKSLFRSRLVNELRLIVCPVALGAGISVTPDDLGQTSLEPISVTPYPNGAVELVYQTGSRQ